MVGIAAAGFGVGGAIGAAPLAKLEPGGIGGASCTPVSWGTGGEFAVSEPLRLVVVLGGEPRPTGPPVELNVPGRAGAPMGLILLGIEL